MPDKPNTPIVMTFSGHDATGGAGLAADMESLLSQGCHPVTVPTCLTVQDSSDVQAVKSIEPEFVVQTARAVLEDMPVAAFKVGLTGNLAIVEAIHSILYDYPDVPVVLDPVLASGNGRTLVEDDLVDALRSLLLPMTTVVTPNTLEAARLMPEADTHSAMASGLMDLGSDYVLLTGTHHEDESVINRLYFNHREIDHYSWPRLPHEYHGSGCTLAATLAGLLAQGLDVLSASREAQHFTWQSLENGRRLGMGQLFPNRFFWLEDE